MLIPGVTIQVSNRLDIEWEHLYYYNIERSKVMIEIEEVLELFIAADEETKTLVEQILKESQQNPEHQE